MQAAGLLTRDRAAASRREIVLLSRGSGRQLAEWVRGRRRAALRDVMETMSPGGREALAQGLRELAAESGAPGRGARRGGRGAPRLSGPLVGPRYPVWLEKPR
jgi:hypothetical protein